MLWTSFGWSRWHLDLVMHRLHTQHPYSKHGFINTAQYYLACANIAHQSQQVSQSRQFHPALSQLGVRPANDGGKFSTSGLSSSSVVRYLYQWSNITHEPLQSCMCQGNTGDSHLWASEKV